MKLSEWYRSPSGRVWLMTVVIVTLLVMIATRWAHISHAAGDAFRERFSPPAEQAAATTAAPDSVRTSPPAAQADSAATGL